MSTLEVARRVAGSRCFLRQSGALIVVDGLAPALSKKETQMSGAVNNTVVMTAN